MVDGAASLSTASPSRFLLLLRVGSIRYSAFYFIAYYGGIAATGNGSLAWAATAWFFSLTVCLGIELLNRHADQAEDGINNPIRTAMCERIGYRLIKRIAVIVWVLLVPTGVIWCWLWSNLQLFCLQISVVLLAINYSSGLRLKAWRHVVYAALSATFLLPFLVGWGTYEPFWSVPLQVLIVPLFIASIAGIKDLTDLEGDRAIGYHSAFVELISRGSGQRLLTLALTPHAALGLSVALGAVPARALLSLCFVPLSILLIMLAPAALRAGKHATLRETMYHVWFAYIAIALATLQPTPEMFGGIASATVFWIVASQWLHWTRGFRWSEVRELLHLAAARSPQARQGG